MHLRYGCGTMRPLVRRFSDPPLRHRFMSAREPSPLVPRKTGDSGSVRLRSRNDGEWATD